MPDPSGRGPLTFIILARLGEDVRNRINCQLCDQSFQGVNLPSASPGVSVGKLFNFISRACLPDSSRGDSKEKANRLR